MTLTQLLNGIVPVLLPLIALPDRAAAEAAVVVYGATPGGFCAAIAAAREGASVTLLEPTDHVGGMSTGGLSHSIGRQSSIGLVGESNDWHKADEAGRRVIWEAHKRYALEVYQFLTPDTAVPQAVQKTYSKHGLRKDEFATYDHFKPRERMLAQGQVLKLSARPKAEGRKTAVSVEKDKFLINGQPTYKGRTWNGKPVEGLLMNSRMVQATFDDRNPETAGRWAYPDSKKWDADRNTAEFVEMMPTWRKHGLLAVTLNLQGGSPEGYSKSQPWHNSAINADGTLDEKYLTRLAKVIDTADELGMVVILGLYYFGQDERVKDEQAVVAGVDAAVDWLVAKKYTNVLVEVDNECNVKAYDHDILKPERVHVLIERVKKRSAEKEHPLLAGTSYGGNTVPKANVVKASDFLLLHGNGVKEPKRIGEMVRQTRQVAGYRPVPILFNEDDHFDFDKPVNNFAAAVTEYASWGYFDFRMTGEGFDDGYQSVPVNWKTSSDRKKGFYRLLSEITGENP